MADTIAFSTPSGPQTWIEKMYLRERQDCHVFGCQLSLGHPLPHCCIAAGGRYQMVDEHGTILREL